MDILEQGELKDIKKTGYICFTEAPLPSLVKMFEYFDGFPSPMYCPYGFGIPKETIFKLGGRPVIYGDNDDYDRLKSIGLEWRWVHYHPLKGYDFTWLREWRVPVDTIKLTYDNAIVVTKTIQEEIDLTMDLDDIEVDAEPDDGGTTVSYTGQYTRKIPSISLEKIKLLKVLTPSQLDGIISNCSKVENIYMGSEWH